MSAQTTMLDIRSAVGHVRRTPAAERTEGPSLLLGCRVSAIMCCSVSESQFENAELGSREDGREHSLLQYA